MKSSLLFTLFVLVYPNSHAVMESIVTMGGKELYIRGDRERKTGIFVDVPVFKADGSPLKVGKKPQKLPSGTLVQADLVDKKGNIYSGAKNFVPHPGRLLHIRVLKDENDEAPARKITGFVVARTLHHKKPRRPMSFYTPDTKKISGRYSIKKAKKKVEACGSKCRKRFTVDDALDEFHSTLCNTISPSDSDLRGALIDRWRKYIAVKGKGLESVTRKAMEQDLVARTILYEAHPPGVLDQKQNGLNSCEWDLIGLSILNRGRICKGYMQCKLISESPSASAATAPNQYHIWRQENIRNTFMSACFLRSDLRGSKNNKRFKNLKGDSAEKFERVRKAFEKIIKRVSVIFDAPKPKKGRSKWRKHVMTHFDVKKIDEQNVPKSWKTKKGNFLLDFTHYYHRGGLLTCRVENYHKTRFVHSAYIKIQIPGQVEQWGLLLKERIDFGNKRNSTGHEYEIFFPKSLDRGRLVYVSPHTEMGAHVYLDKRVTASDKNTLYTCLPDGKLPQCLGDKDLQAPIYGKRVPTTWFSKGVKKKVAKMYSKLNVDLGAHWRKRRSSRGQALAVTCKNPKFYKKRKGPSFKGLCDSQFMPVTGAD